MLRIVMLCAVSSKVSTHMLTVRKICSKVQQHTNASPKNFRLSCANSPETSCWSISAWPGVFLPWSLLFSPKRLHICWTCLWCNSMVRRPSGNKVIFPFTKWTSSPSLSISCVAISYFDFKQPTNFSMPKSRRPTTKMSSTWISTKQLVSLVVNMQGYGVWGVIPNWSRESWVMSLCHKRLPSLCPGSTLPRP